MKEFLACPVCKLPLAKAIPKLYICENNHSFDVAKQGYVNLLLASQGSKELGDSHEMFLHRRQFLDKGLYNPISDNVNGLVGQEIDRLEASTLNILDAGCGEGYYTKRLRDFLLVNLPTRSYNISGVDISKYGVQIAAKRDKQITFAVASVSNLPVLDGSLDIIVSFFSPVNYQEFSRVLEPGGKLITVKAGPNHLFNLRRIIYADRVEPLQDKASSKYEDYFDLVGSDEINYKIDLQDSSTIIDLAMMTPYAWHLDDEAKQRLSELPLLQVQVEANVKIFEKRPFSREETIQSQVDEPDSL